ncbi:MAG: hypothetical protein IT355_12080 [Gemmatimonadaceae bacterium]|nr:hypothetical protein [Gemmatimonadaceae bacterium]
MTVLDPRASVQTVTALRARHALEVQSAAHTLGRELRRVRAALGWSLRQAQRAAAIRSWSQVQRVEAGDWRPVVAARLAECYARELRRRPSHTLTLLPDDGRD